MCSCHSILECCVTFSGVKLSIRSFVIIARTAVHLNLLGQWSRVLMSEQQVLIFYNEMFIIETAVSSANL